MAEADDPIKEEFHIKDFDIENKRFLGDGRSGETYKVHCTKDSKLYALKKTKGNASTNEDTEKELEQLSRIKHENIIGFFGVVQLDDRPCIVLEYAAGGDLYKFLHKKTTENLISRFEKENLIRNVCCGLMHLHHDLKTPVRHGDIKSPNILLCLNGRRERVAKLADFGLSEEVTNTKSGDGNGTARWAAPEVFSSEEPIKTTKSDVWAFGAVVWEIWTECLPFAKLGDLKIMHYILHDKKTPYGYDPESDNKVPETYRKFLKKCFDSEYKKRWTIKMAHAYLKTLEREKDDEEYVCRSDTDGPPQFVWTNSNLPLEVRDRYTKALVRLTTELEDNEELFPKFQDLFRTEIGRGLRQRLKTPRDFIDKLEQQAVMSPLDTSLLEKRLRFLKEGERLAEFFSDQPSPQSLQSNQEGRKTLGCENLGDREGIGEKIDGFENLKESVPPDNFRDYSVAPTEEELTNTEGRIFLRKNKVKGSYKSVDDYLDVHFRLMREDFVIPLRKGIIALKNIEKAKETKMPVPEVRTYRNATVQYPVCLKDGIGHVVRFDSTPFKNSCWERNKRLMFGSFLCFFLEDYSQALFATVVQRDANALRQRGEITVKFITESLAQSSMNEKFILIESSAYFESYRHVLTRLQVLKKETFPLTQHIVFCDREVKAPEYLLRDSDSDGPAFDFQCIMKEESDTEVRANPLDFKTWPSKEELGLDASQYSALQTTVTHRIALIQGPPGAGKTFMGLKITKLLLENVVKRQENFGPILVISYTNHALDQFLEGIAKFPDVKIVRVGSQSKSELLKNFTLSKIRQKYIEEHNFSRQLSSTIKKIKLDIGKLYEDIMNNSARLRAIGEHVANLNVLQKFIKKEHYSDIVGSAQPSQAHNKTKEWLSETTEELAIQLHALTLSTPETANECEDDENDGDESMQFEDEAMIETTRRKLEGDDEKNDVGKTLDQKIEKLMGRDFIKWDNLDPKSKNGKDKSQNKALYQFLRRQLDSEDCMSEEEEKAIDLTQILSTQIKWRLYRLWRHRYRNSLHTILEHLKEKYDAQCKELKKMMMESDRFVLSSHQVIAMTTTGAARYGEILSVLRPKIVIVEEAAEVLESHVMAALTESCEHLILIGDHKQLRPKNTTYEIAEKYKLNVSMFERLIINEFHFDTLGLQHRMRPEIAYFLRQEVLYPNLEDHSSVMHYPNIKGIAHNYFFLSHEHEESKDELRSYSNDFEARYADRLCKHLLMQGYEPKTITILTLYSGQYTRLTRQRTISGESRTGLKVAVVDNYQGEENDIIILSLVRSNEQSKIGFAGNNNRICVAMSRARMGLYVLGNIMQFRTTSELWKEVVTKAEAKNRVGPQLELTCQLHPKHSPMLVSSEKHFDEYSPDGGCSKPCGSRLNCGHVCKKACHPTDREHKEYKCQEQIDVEWKNCGHQVPCFKSEVFEKVCKEQCERRLSCGHQCQKKCGEPCTRTNLCTVMESKISSFCDHEVSIKCSSQDKEGVCNKPCKETLSCGHKCSGNCSSCSEGRIHQACPKKCNHTLLCGHKCSRLHPRECPSCEENCEMHCAHSNCKLRCGERCNECRLECVNKCQHRACSKLCHAMCDSPPCDQVCDEKFVCIQCKTKVECIGLCGEKCIHLCRSCDSPKLSRSYLNPEDENKRNARFLRLETCQHIFEVSGLDKWINDESAATIGVKRCPRCEKTITLKSCMRYMNQVRRSVAEMHDINDLVADDDKFEARKRNLIGQLHCLKLENLAELTKNDKFLPKFRAEAKKATTNYASDVLHYAEVVSLLKDLEEHSKQIVKSEAGLDYLKAAKHVLDGLLTAFNRHITSATLEQCRMEALRFGDMQQICRFHGHAQCEQLWAEYMSNWTEQFSRRAHGQILRRIEAMEREERDE